MKLIRAQDDINDTLLPAQRSLTNTLLIAQQCHARGIEPTYVAGFKAWLRLGRCVREGEKGLRIWAPMRLRVGDQDGADADERKLRFRLASVFDVSQTEPLPDVEPAPLSPPGVDGIGGDSHAHLLPALEQLAADSGCTLTWVDQLPGGAKGRCHRGGRTIEVLAGLPANDRVQVLIPSRKHRIRTSGMGGGGRSRLLVWSDSNEARRASEDLTKRRRKRGPGGPQASLFGSAEPGGEQEPSHSIRSRTPGPRTGSGNELLELAATIALSHHDAGYRPRGRDL